MSKKMTDEERQALAQKMDNDFQQFLEEKMKKGVKDDYEKDIDKIVAELAQHPAFIKELDYTKPLPPLIQGLQAIKFESDSPEDNADNYKDDGNLHFKRKSYRFAMDNYSKGINEKCADRLLNAQLYTNRAASQFHIGNFRSSLIDATVARKFVPDHVKAVLRGAQCCIELRRYADAIRWCDDGLQIDETDKRFLDIRSKAEKLKRQKERDERKQLAQERKAEVAQRALIDAIKARGVQLGNNMKATTATKDATAATKDALLLSSIESQHPSGAKVKMNGEGQLVWPVLFTYPQVKETDFIAEFNEQNTIYEHLHVMFGDESAPWDEHNYYKPDDIIVYFENRSEEKLYKVDVKESLSLVLQHKKMVVHGGTPNFHIVSRRSPFTKSFLAEYKISLPDQ